MLLAGVQVLTTVSTSATVAASTSAGYSGVAWACCKSLPHVYTVTLDYQKGLCDVPSTCVLTR